MRKNLGELLIFNDGAIVGFILGALFFWYELQDKKISRFSYDLISNYRTEIINALIVFILTTILSNLIIHIHNLFKHDGLIAKEINNKFYTTIQQFANIHEGFIYGMYDNYPHEFTKLFDYQDRKFYITKILDKPAKSDIRGLYIWFRNVDVDSYAQLASKLLGLTKKSIYSTTYFDNADLIKVLKEKRVRKWIKEVNNKKNLSIVRVHIFKEENNEDTCNELHKEESNTEANNHGCSKEMNDFIEQLKKDKKAWKFYKCHYIQNNKPKRNFYVFILKNNIEAKFFGEYIIFDEKLMIKYDEDFKTLEVYIGKVVNIISREFIANDPKIFFPETENFIKAIKGIDCNKK